MNLLNIRQNLENFDYSWTKPQTYLIFVPGLSLIVQKIQLANTLPLITDVTCENSAQANAKARKFTHICKWHITGSITQIIACTIAVQVFAVPLFSLLTLFSAYELVDTLLKRTKNLTTLYEFHANGHLKSSKTLNF